MRIDHDVCKRALESLHDEGVYLVDKDRLTIYYMGKDTGTLLGLGLESGTTELASGNMPVGLIADPDSQSQRIPGQHDPGTGSAEHDRWAVVCGLRDETPDPSHVFTTISAVKNENGETVGAVQVFEDREEVSRIKQRLQELERMVLVDPLTRVGNRRYAEIHVQCCLDEMCRYEWPFGVLFIDVDYFKSINDRFGHISGDAVLRATAHTLVSCLRSSDLVCRWGGEEFVVVLKNVGKPQIGRIAEKVRRIVAQLCIPKDRELLGITISIGAAVARSDDSVASLIDRADKLMYESKQAGRNRVTIDADGTLT